MSGEALAVADSAIRSLVGLVFKHQITQSARPAAQNLVIKHQNQFIAAGIYWR